MQCSMRELHLNPAVEIHPEMHTDTRAQGCRALMEEMDRFASPDRQEEAGREGGVGSRSTCTL